MSFLSHINPFGGHGHNPLDPSSALAAINDATHGALAKIEAEAKTAVEKEASKVADTIKDKIEPEIKEAIQPAIDEIKKDIEPLVEDLEKAVVDVLVPLGEKAIKPAFATAAALWPIAVGKASEWAKKHPARRREINRIPFIVTISLGVVNVGLYWHGLLDRSDEIKNRLHYYSQHDIGHTRSQIRDALNMLAPDALDFDAGGKISLGVQIGLRAGFWGVPSDIAFDALDELLKQAGVPA